MGYFERVVAGLSERACRCVFIHVLLTSADPVYNKRGDSQQHWFPSKCIPGMQC